jgi:anaerobic magnesium-protoporphyrin IX monomethyl ester cyclase
MSNTSCMTKILFTHSYFLRFDPKQRKIGLPYAPLGTLFAASLMRENRYSVALHDVMFSKSPDEICAPLKKHYPEYFVIFDDGFNYLTKMCLTNMREAAFKMMKHAKSKGCTVIVSSSDATDHFDRYINEGADFVLLGEAEHTLLELVEALEEGKKDFSTIKGLAFKRGDEIIKTSKRDVIKDLDSLPLPAWDIINLEPYKKLWLQNAGYFSMNVATTRGCPFKCNWCAKPIYGNRYNSRSPQNVIKELKLLKEQYQYDHIWFCDDIFGLKPGWVNEFAELGDKEGLKLRFKIQSRADLLVQENYVHALAKAGCENVWMGAESGSQKILDAMDKGTQVEQIYKAVELLRLYKIKPAFFIQFGYPGETKDDIRLTVKMINQLLPSEIGISVSYPLPGTVFYDRVKAELTKKANWTDSDEMALMFRNTYKPEFYKQLHTYVHRSYRTHLAISHIKQLLSKPQYARLTTLKKALSALYYLPITAFERRKLNQLAKLN